MGDYQGSIICRTFALSGARFFIYSILHHLPALALGLFGGKLPMYDASFFARSAAFLPFFLCFFVVLRAESPGTAYTQLLLAQYGVR